MAAVAFLSVIFSLGVIIILVRFRRRLPGKPSSTQAAACERGVHLIQVSADDKDTDIDIIAIHGLDTKFPNTWEYQVEDKKVNWLTEPGMLPTKAARARIFCCNWPANLFERSDLRQKTIDEFARLLLAGIKRRPLPVNDVAGNDRPILFIASCLGGVILMKALVNADDSNDYLPLRKATRGIVFLATPFRGTSFQDVAAWAEPGLETWASVRGREVSRLLHEVKNSFDLEELVLRFTQLCRDEQHPYEIFTFYELGKTSLPRKILPFLPAMFAQEKPLVDRSSATLDIVPNPLPLDRTHKMTNKLYGSTDPAYECLVGKIEEMLRRIRENSPLQQADAWIRKKFYTGDRLKIERLSGESLPMDQCYINLAIVEQARWNTRGSQGAMSAQQSSQFSLFAWLRVDEPEERVKVVLPTLFSSRKTCDDKMIEPKRVLIRGRAGVGKTTLCKKIVYDFTHGTLWSDLFDRLLWVPLRNLKLKERCQVAGYNFYRLFYDEYFSQHSQGSNLAQELWNALNHTKRTLFLLDGLDEVSQDLDSGGDMFRFLKELLDQPNVIITSRPHAAMLPAGLKSVDLELETIGFYPDQLNDYLLRAAFKNDPGKAIEVQLFLKEYPLIQGLVRIPIQLDALCYTWDGFSGQSIPQTLTAIYQAIERKLWQKKDVMRLEKQHDGQPVTPWHIESADMDQIVECEKYLLEGFAFTGLFNYIVDFDLKHRMAISKQFKFPEYFAARYFVRQWADGQLLDCLKLEPRREIRKTEPAEFLRRYKYDQYYDIFWRFVSGLLDAEGETETLRFFQTIEETSPDLMALEHQRLVMHCLNELVRQEGKSRLSQLRSELEGRLSEWLIVECRFKERPPQLASERELPDQVLIRALLQASDKEKILILKPLASRPVIHASIIDLVYFWLRHGVSRKVEIVLFKTLRHPQAAWSCRSMKLTKHLEARLEDKDSNVRQTAVEALSSRQDLSPETVNAIAGRLEDKDWGVRRAAFEALSRQDLSLEAVKVIAGQLDHEDLDVQWVAVAALSSRQDLSPEAVNVIAGRLEDKDWEVRQAAVAALSSWQVLRPETVNAIAGRLEDKNWDVQWAAVDALSSQQDLSPEAVNIIVRWLEHEDLDVKWAAVDALSSQQDLSPEAVNVIARRLEHEDSVVRELAARVLSSQQYLSPETMKVIAGWLEHEDSVIQWAAVAALSGQQDLGPETVNAIAGRLEDTNWEVRQAAVAALSSWHVLRPETMNAIAGRLEDTNWEVRQAAVDALSNQHDLNPETVDAIAGWLEHEDSVVRELAARILSSQQDLSPDTVNAIIGRLEDTDWDVRQVAVAALSIQQDLSPEIMNTIAGWLEDTDWDVRWAAVAALSIQQGLSPEIVSAIAGRLEDTDWEVQRAAVAALSFQQDLSPETVNSIAGLLEQWRLSSA